MASSSSESSGDRGNGYGHKTENYNIADSQESEAYSGDFRTSLDSPGDGYKPGQFRITGTSQNSSRSWLSDELSIPLGVDLSLLQNQERLREWKVEGGRERKSREAFELSGGYAACDRVCERLYRMIQRTGSIGGYSDSSTEALTMYSTMELYELSTSPQIMEFGTEEIESLQEELLELDATTAVEVETRAPEDVQADSFMKLDEKRPFHKIYVICEDIDKLVDAVELTVEKWNAPAARVLSIEDRIITQQCFGKSLKISLTVEFLGIAWRVVFKTRPVWIQEDEQGNIKKTLLFIQQQFLFAAIWKKPEKLRRLLALEGVEAIADPNEVRDAVGLSGLHHAAIQGDLDSAELLVKAKANVWLQDKHGKPPLYHALRFGRKEMGEYLMEKMKDDKDSDENLIAICSCLEFHWEDQCPLIPSVLKLKTYIKTRYIHLLAESRFSEFCQLAKYTGVRIEDATLLRIVAAENTTIAAALLQALDEDSSVDLSNLNLQSRHVKEIAESLNAETEIGSLDMSGNKQLCTDPGSGIIIARLVALAPLLRVLVLEDCGLSAEAFHGLATRIENWASLIRMSFKKNRFMLGTVDAGIGMHAVFRIATLEQLDLTLCGLFTSAAEALSTRLNRYVNIRILRLDHNPYAGKDFLFGEALANILHYAQKIDVLSLSGCDISSVVMDVLGKSLLKKADVRPQVRQLDLQKNIRLGNKAEAGRGLGILLQRCETIDHVNLSYAGLTPAAILMMGKTMVEYGHCSARNIDLGNNYKLGASADAGIGLALVLMRCTNLLDFNIRGCHFSPAAVSALGNALTSTVSFRNIDLFANWHLGSAPEGGRGFGLFLQKAESLQVLDLTHCGLTSDSLAALGSAIETDINMRKIILSKNDEVGVTNEGGRGMGQLLKKARSLEEFYFVDSQVSPQFIEGLRDSLSEQDDGEAPTITCKIIQLRVTPSSLGPASTAMGEMLANLLMASSFLHSCELERCNLDSVTMAKLGLAVTRNVAVKKITFAKNDAIGAFPSGGTGIGQFMRRAIHLEEISLKQTGFSAQACEALGVCLRKSILSLKQMDMSNNPRLGSSGSAGRGMAYFLKCCPQLELLNLSCSHFGADAIARLSNVVSEEKITIGVKRVNFVGNTELAHHINGGAALGSFVSVAYNLEWLNLSRCGLTQVALNAIINHAKIFNALLYLDISESVVEKQTDVKAERNPHAIPAGASLGELVNFAPRLKELRAGECAFNPPEFFAFGKTVKPNYLENVDLSNNIELGITATGGQGLGLFLQKSPNIIKLNLMHCGITSYAIEAITTTRGFRSMHYLETLLLSSNPLGGSTESGIVLGNFLGYCPALSYLTLQSCDLTAETLGAFGHTLAHQKTTDKGQSKMLLKKLNTIDFTNNPNLGNAAIMGDGLADLMNSMTIIEVNLACCGLTATALSVLAENINDHRSKTIKKMLFAGNKCLGKSEESGRTMFALLQKFRVEVIDLSDCGITSQAMTDLGFALDDWRTEMYKVQAIDSMQLKLYRRISQQMPSSFRPNEGEKKDDKQSIVLSPIFMRSVLIEAKLYGFLKEFNLSNNPEMAQSESAGDALGKLLTTAETIEEVTLANCGFTGEAIFALSQHVEQMHINHLDLSRNTTIAIDETGSKGLQTVFSNLKIESVTMDDCKVPMEFAPGLSG